MTLRASVDIETLSTRPNAVVLSLGICFFDDEKMQPFEEIVANGIELFFDRQCQSSRHIDTNTIAWWMQQGEKAKRCMDPDPDELITPRDFHAVLETFCTRIGVHYGWVMKHCKWYARGPHFDVAIMDSLFADHNVTAPWKFWNVRDIRTWLECNGLTDNVKLIKPESMVPHNPLHDAAFDAYMMQRVLHTNPADLDIDEDSGKRAKQEAA